jgi:maltose O-acetyltransferase
LPYNAFDPIILNGSAFAYKMCQKLNQMSQLEIPQRNEILVQLLGTCSQGVYIEPPFYCDYGSNIHLVEGVFLNYDCTFLDSCEINVGPRTLLAPGC